MDNLFKIKAKIIFLENSLRNWPIKDGYRPLVDFGNDMKTSGIIKLLEGDSLNKGEQTQVLISFFSNEPLKTIVKGATFKFFEWPNLIGTGVVDDILGEIVT